MKKFSLILLSMLLLVVCSAGTMVPKVNVAKQITRKIGQATDILLTVDKMISAYVDGVNVTYFNVAGKKVSVRKNLTNAEKSVIKKDVQDALDKAILKLQEARALVQ